MYVHHFPVLARRWAQCGSSPRPDMIPAAALVLAFTAAAAAQYAGCPEQYGLQVYPHEQYCDKFYKCANGRLF